MTSTLYTVVFLKRNNKILLGLKTRGLGVGLWNGFGGKVEVGETILNGAHRELKEECNVEALDLKHLGVVTYEEHNLHKSIIHVFTARRFTGTLKPSEEMNPIQWFKYSEIPFQKMWPDAKKWYPMLLQEKHFYAWFKCKEDGSFTVSEIQEIDECELKNTYHLK